MLRFKPCPSRVSLILNSLNIIIFLQLCCKGTNNFRNYQTFRPFFCNFPQNFFKKTLYHFQSASSHRTFTNYRAFCLSNAAPRTWRRLTSKTPYIIVLTTIQNNIVLTTIQNNIVLTTIQNNIVLTTIQTISYKPHYRRYTQNRRHAISVTLKSRLQTLRPLFRRERAATSLRYVVLMALLPHEVIL